MSHLLPRTIFSTSDDACWNKSEDKIGIKSPSKKNHDVGLVFLGLIEKCFLKLQCYKIKTLINGGVKWNSKSLQNTTRIIYFFENKAICAIQNRKAGLKKEREWIPPLCSLSSSWYFQKTSHWWCHRRAWFPVEKGGKGSWTSKTKAAFTLKFAPFLTPIQNGYKVS